MKTQASPLRTEVSVSMAGQVLPARSLNGVERLNHPTRLSVCLNVVDRYDLPDSLGNLLDQPVSVTITGPGLITPRHFHLNLHGANESWQGDAYQLDLTLSSKLDRGRQQSQARLFMGMTRDQVLWQLLWEMGYERIEVDLALDPVPAFEGPYLQVQDETTLGCFQRLLAEVGANYWFEDRSADQNHELLVIRNDALSSPYLPHIEWGQTVSGLAPDQQLNRITAVYQRWSEQPHSTSRYVSGTVPGSVSRENTSYQTFTSPRPRPEAEQRALFEQQFFDQQRYFLTLHSHQPLLSAGHTVALDARQLPNDCPTGEYRMVEVTHTAESNATAGVQYRNTAAVIPQATPPRPRLAEPAALPHLFPVRIESRYDHAELGVDGHYYFRADFDRSTRGISLASPPTSRLVPYASPQQDATDPTGWHFPLLDQSRALVTFLDDDPSRPMIVGFVPGQQQLGPVTADNAAQSRIVTPGQNELTFDDTHKTTRIALHTFDRQVRLELNAREAEPYIHLMAIYGSINLYAALTINIKAEAQLEERIGADRTQSVKNDSLTQTEEGAIHHQAATDHTHIAQAHFTQSAGADFSIWVQQKNLTIKAMNGQSTTVTSGDLQLQVQSGAAIHQVNGNIHIQGNGNGDILLKQGDGGIKIDPSGNIKLFGKKVTLNGQNGVTFNGDVQYEVGAGNEPEETEPLDLLEIVELEWLTLEAEETAETESEPGDYRLPIRIVDGSLQPLPGIEVKCAHLHNSEPLTATTNSDGLAVFTVPNKVKRGLISYEHNGQTRVRPFHAGTLAPSDVEVGKKQRLTNLSATARLPGKKDARAAEQVFQALSDELNTQESNVTDTLGRQE
ncbi:contractile injection system protein, VgrG/Pvc8 family [Saccharospirillum impatiens]|uniref:contractile injection system protein, VgrG/Pvc8 family n=1 Tax=Saccharospirillum impatiens TaxID=169438 RepID=UPI00146E2430|nr:contractile injection system protein, VgrG/Pvc8 family [Saccharospirillum impatiens]